MSEVRKDWAVRARDRLSSGRAALLMSLGKVPIEEENPEAIALQNALDLVETALYWLESYDEV